MKGDIKRRWVEALRSGEYRQTRSTLRSVNDDEVEGYCCLGVLTQLYAIEHQSEHYWDGGRFYDYGGDLPPMVVSWAGLDTEDRDPEVDGRCLTTHNDGLADHGFPARTFNEIADLIEQFIPGDDE